MAERSCIPFKTIKFKFGQGASFGDTLLQVKNVTGSIQDKLFSSDYLHKLPLKNRVLHNLAYTAFGLTLAVGYEFVRLKHPEFNLPALEPAIPAASLTPSRDSVSYELHTEDGSFTKEELPKEIGGKSVEWDSYESKGPKDATFHGHKKN